MVHAGKCDVLSCLAASLAADPAALLLLTRQFGKTMKSTNSTVARSVSKTRML